MNNTSLRQNGYGQCCFLNALMLLIYTRTPFFPRSVARLVSQLARLVGFPTQSTGRFPNSVDRSVPQHSFPTRKIGRKLSAH